MSNCTINKCSREIRYKEKQWCKMHYLRWTRHGDPLYEVIVRSGLSKTPHCNILKHIVQRCTNPKNPAYPDYGGRGIKVCDRWRGTYGLTNFYADMGVRPQGKTIDRINNDGNYEPGNCRWASRTVQSRNRRKFKNNTSGVVGVSWYSRDKCWRVSATINGKPQHIAYTDTIDEAAKLLSSFLGRDKQVHNG